MAAVDQAKIDILGPSLSVGCRIRIRGKGPSGDSFDSIVKLQKAYAPSKPLEVMLEGANTFAFPIPHPDFIYTSVALDAVSSADIERAMKRQNRPSIYDPTTLHAAAHENFEETMLVLKSQFHFGADLDARLSNVDEFKRANGNAAIQKGEAMQNLKLVLRMIAGWDAGPSSKDADAMAVLEHALYMCHRAAAMGSRTNTLDWDRLYADKRSQGKSFSEAVMHANTAVPKSA